MKKLCIKLENKITYRELLSRKFSPQIEISPNILNDKRVNLPPSPQRRHTGGADVQVDEFLTSVQDGDEWTTSRPGRFTPREET